MSPAQRTITLPVLLATPIFIAVFFTACSDKIKTDLNVFKALDESLVNSNITIEKGSQNLYASLEQKMSEPSTSEKAKQWFPKAMQIQKLSTDAYKYIEELKTELKKEAGLKEDEDSKSFRESDKNAVMRLFEKMGKGGELFERLKNYKHDILAVNSELGKEFNSTIFLATQAFDIVKTKQDFTKTFFDDIPTVAALAMLSKFQNNIKVNENRMAAFCNNKIGSTDGWGFFTIYSALAIISSSYVKPGEQIEITSGIGSFSKAAQPIFLINGKDVSSDTDGAAHYKFKASSKPGKHFVPVEISFTDQEGQKQTITKNIEYTVAN